MLQEMGATQSGCRNTGVHHVGLHAKDPAAAAEFYRDVLEMHIVGGSESDHPLGASAFLCSRPDQESHEIALFENPTFAHVAFKVSSLAELRSVHARVARAVFLNLVELSFPVVMAHCPERSPVNNRRNTRTISKPPSWSIQFLLSQPSHHRIQPPCP